MMKRIRSIILLLIFFAILLLPVLLSAEEDVAAAIYKEGLKKYVLGDYDGAVEDFDRALKLKPGDALIRKMYINTLLKKGNLEYETGNLKKAEKYFTKAYTLSGEDEKLRKNIIMIQEQIEEQKQEIALIGAEIEREETAQGKTAQSREGGSEPERIELILPFNMDEFIQQQNDENKRIFSEIMEVQKQERENLFQRIAEGQQFLDESVRSQRAEREKLFTNLEDSRNLINENIKSQQEERENLYEKIDESRRVLDESMKTQQDEKAICDVCKINSHIELEMI
ncbi:MAG: hypothetical protein AMS17_03150 [Spirochaetes bacterium DG_61]|nr:MAG: hypothetical protein AMS17_03150 [Spirochaetes bacterium DG_61]